LENVNKMQAMAIFEHSKRQNGSTFINKRNLRKKIPKKGNRKVYALLHCILNFLL